MDYLELQTVAMWAQVVTGALTFVAAVGAVAVAWRAHKSASGQKLREFKTETLLRWMRQAERVRSLYAAVFKSYPTFDAKTRAKNEFLAARDDIAAELRLLRELLDADDRLNALWRDLEECEDSHLNNELTVPPAAAKEAAMRPFDVALEEIRGHLVAQIEKLNGRQS